MNKMIEKKKAAGRSRSEHPREDEWVLNLPVGGQQVLLELKVPKEERETGELRIAGLAAMGMLSYGEKLAGQVRELEGRPEEEAERLAAFVGGASGWTTELLLHSLAHRHEELAELTDPRRRLVTKTLSDIAAMLLAAAHEKAVTNKALEEKAQAAIDTMTLVVSGGNGSLETLIDALEAPAVEGYVDIDDSEAEARARLRLHALYQRVIRDSFTVEQLRSALGISRQRLKQLRDDDRLFAINVPFQRSLLYPRWQFEPVSGRPREEMAELIAAAREGGLDGVGFHMLMNNPAAGGGLSPLDLLENGQLAEVRSILRAADQ